jgi:hypothetical protein
MHRLLAMLVSSLINGPLHDPHWTTESFDDETVNTKLEWIWNKFVVA